MHLVGAYCNGVCICQRGLQSQANEGRLFICTADPYNVDGDVLDPVEVGGGERHGVEGEPREAHEAAERRPHRRAPQHPLPGQRGNLRRGARWLPDVDVGGDVQLLCLENSTAMVGYCDTIEDDQASLIMNHYQLLLCMINIGSVHSIIDPLPCDILGCSEGSPYTRKM